MGMGDCGEYYEDMGIGNGVRILTDSESDTFFRNPSHT